MCWLQEHSPTNNAPRRSGATPVPLTHLTARYRVQAHSMLFKEKTSLCMLYSHTWRQESRTATGRRARKQNEEAKQSRWGNYHLIGEGIEQSNDG